MSAIAPVRQPACVAGLATAVYDGLAFEALGEDAGQLLAYLRWLEEIALRLGGMQTVGRIAFVAQDPAAQVSLSTFLQEALDTCAAALQLQTMEGAPV